MIKNSLLRFGTAILCLLSAGMYGQQIDLEIGQTPEELANLITGNGVQILNPVINCADSAYGVYDISSIDSFANGDGLVLSTGNVFNIEGPNVSTATTTEWGTPGDPLITLIAGATSFDACSFEFDVVPVGDTLRFDFTFASEEYTEYVGTPFNDVFAFFIKGPGIVGNPQLDGFENIALIPGTNTPVGINTVNNGNPDIGFPPQNPEFFVVNPPGFGAQFEYDGRTTGLFAQRVVNACDTFQLKLVIADVGDRKWDSSVFIEAIESNSISLASQTVGGIENMIRGCNNGSVTFTRTPVSGSPLDVTYFIGGTAENGVDYPQIGDDPDPDVPKTITIPANEASVTIDIEPFESAIGDGDKTIIFYVGNPLCEGTIQDSLVFVIQDSLFVEVVPPLSFICLGDSLTLNVNEGGTAFNWSPADFLDDSEIMEPTVFPNDDIIYTLTTTVAECTTSTTAEIRVSNILLGADVTDIACAGAESGAIDLSVSGGETPYDFEWSGPAGFTSTDQNIADLQPGTYSVEVTDREGCTEILSATVEESASIELTLSSPEFAGGNNVSCSGAQDGQATVSAEGGTPGYTYLWDDPASQTSQTATGLGAGTYTVIVTDAIGCEETSSITLTAPAPIAGELDEREDVTCFGESTGSLSIIASGGTPPYNYLWNTVPPQTGPDISNVGAGIYTVTITDVNGCIGFAEAEILQPDAPLSGSVSVTPASCNGFADGSAAASIIGGTPPYTYSWSSNPGNNTPSEAGLPAGGYNLTVIDENGCELSLPFNIGQPSPITISVVSSSEVDCFGEATGSVTVNASGGNGGFSYTWNTDPETLGAALTDVPAGTYTVTATDSEGCFETLEVTIGEPDEILTIDITAEDPSCSGINDGTITADAQGGTAPYSYSWNTTPPATGSTLTNLGPGSYTVTATDVSGCVTTETVILTAPDPISLSVSDLQNVLCNGDATGSVTINIAGGTEPYTLLWNDPANQTTPTATDLGAGTYTLSVTDANSCGASIQVEITEPAEPLGGNVISTTDVVCFGDNTGSATVTGTGGSGSYSYQWNDPTSQETSTASNLAPGVYEVTITDNNGCDTPVVLTIEIEGPVDPFEVELVPSLFAGGFNVACADDSTATIDLNISGGTAPYEVLWNLPGLDTTTEVNLTDLAPGTYSVTVTDANGCIETGAVTLTAPDPITITFETIPSLCFGAPEGSIDIEIFGGVPGYTVDWEGPNGFTGTGQLLEDIEGGIYSLTIEDANGCVYVDAITVVQPEDLVITVDSISDINGFNTSCWNSQDGAIFVSGDGGVAPYGYTWNQPGNPGFSNQQNVNNVGPGIYEVVLIDDNGCVENEFIEIVGPDPISVAFEPFVYDNGFNISCNGESDGSINAVATGGTPGYTFFWIGAGGFGPVFDNPVTDLPAGEYSVLVQDANGCTFSDAFEINEPPAFSIELIAEVTNGSNISCEGAADGSINLIISGTTAPYSISWTGPDGFTSTDEDLFNLPEGTYCADVTDVNDCTESACITLEAPEELTATLTPLVYANGGNLSCGGADDGEITTAAEGGTAPYTYSWTGPGNFTSTSANITGLVEGNYCLTVTDANGCTAEACAELTAADEIQIELEVTSDLLCEGDDSGSISTTVTGGEEPLEFSWTGPDGFVASTQNIEDLGEGLYCLTVTDAEGCGQEECITITAPQVLNLSLTGSSFEGGLGVSCADAEDGFVLSTVSGGTAPYAYAWTGPDGFTATTPNITDLGAGNYCLTVTDANSCENEQCFLIETPDELQVVADIDAPLCGDSADAEVTLNVSGGTPPYSYNWSSGQNTATVMLGEGSYTVLVSDANGCEVTLPVNITFPPNIFVTLESPIFPGGVNITCNGGATGTVNAIITGDDGNLDYLWTDGGGNFISDQPAPLTGLMAGIYCLEVTDESGCSGSSCITLTEPEMLTLDFEATDLDCNENSGGSITAIGGGGVPAYTISWTGPDGFTAMGSVISGLGAGQYCAEISDINGCTFSDCVEITEPTPISIDLTADEVNGFNISCEGENTGAISSVISGGTPGYTYSWSGPAGFFSPSPNIQNLFAGEYCLTVTDENGCTQEACIELIEAESAEVSVDVFEFANGFNASCGDACDASLTVSITTGEGPFELTWTGPDNFESNAFDLDDLCPGSYVLSVTDVNGCEQVINVQINAPAEIEINLSSPVFGGGTEISCFGFDNGVINADVSGGVEGGFDFSWTGPDGFTSGAAGLTNLAPGTYTLTVEDPTGCSAEESITLAQPDSPLSGNAVAFEYPSGDNISCAGEDDGSIEGTATGGTAPYVYNWFGPNDFTAETQNINDLAPGEYTLIIEDANGCTFTINMTLTGPELPLVTNIESVTEIECFDAATGGIQITVEGGSSPYQIAWTGPDLFSSTDFFIADLAAGVYTYEVTDVNGCSSEGEVELENAPEIIITSEISSAACESESGIIVIAVTGGTPGYEFLWSTGATTQNISNLGAGTYSVNVTDSNGCEVEAEFEVEAVNELAFDVSITEPGCAGDNDGSIALELTGGEAPVMYSWEGPGGFTATGEEIFGLEAGMYSYTALDVNGCIIEDTLMVGEPDSLLIDELVSPLYNNGFNITSFGGVDGVINNPNVEGGTTPYNLSWTGPDGFSSTGAGEQSGLQAGTYELIVTDANGCTDTASTVLTQPVPLELPNGISPNGDGFNDGLTVRGLEDFPNNKMMIFNRWGNMLYEEDNYSNNTPWMGTNNSGENLPEGTYFVILEISDRDALRGYLELRR